MSIAIKVENLSKAYQLGEIGTGTISRDLERWIAKRRGKEDPFLKIGEENDRAAKGTSNVVWSLKDLNFEIQQGDAVGIIGRNGAGKSTLLKLLSRVTAPTTGKIKARGRIASLLEVGTGFHPELTGRENIYLNGAILGMRKKEIDRKFDEIVDFSGVERYIDTPVKRYSSGMYVRLAFAVAAHLESEILIVDEVLAVGDAEFQKKCLGKMGQVSKGEGRTVLFVSHAMASIKALCNNGIVLNKGTLTCSSTANEAIKTYFNLLKEETSHHYVNNKNKPTKISEIYIADESNQIVSTVTKDMKEVYVVFKLALQENHNANLGFTIFNSEGFPLLSSSILDSMEKIELGLNVYKIKIPVDFLKADEYYIEGAFWDNNGTIEASDCFLKFKMDVRSKLEITGSGIKGFFLNPYNWETRPLTSAVALELH